MKKTYPQNFFTAGELANMFQISKQTLLYYDKINLLSPDYVSENGYRHYSIQQYLDLEIITNLRALGVSIADISTYLKNKSKEGFLELLRKRDAECQAIIKENENIRKSLQNIKGHFDNAYPLLLNQITLAYQKERLLQLTELAPNIHDKERVMMFAKHSQFTFHHKGSLEKGVGWVIDGTSFFKKKTTLSKAFFSFAPNIPRHEHKPKFHLPEGLYVEVYISGTFYKGSWPLAEKIAHFLKLNNMHPIGDIYILPVENHWFHSSSERYINKIFLQVEPAAK